MDENNIMNNKLQDIYELAGVEFNINSKSQVETVLQNVESLENKCLLANKILELRLYEANISSL